MAVKKFNKSRTVKLLKLAKALLKAKTAMENLHEEDQAWWSAFMGKHLDGNCTWWDLAMTSLFTGVVCRADEQFTGIGKEEA